VDYKPRERSAAACLLLGDPKRLDPRAQIRGHRHGLAVLGTAGIEVHHHAHAAPGRPPAVVTKHLVSERDRAAPELGHPLMDVDAVAEAARSLEVGLAVHGRKPELAPEYELVVAEPEMGRKPRLHRLVEVIEVARKIDDARGIAVAKADVESEYMNAHQPRVYAPLMPLVEYAAHGGIATLTLCNPPANCYSREMMTELDAAILEARFDPGVHVIVLRGAGEKFFCAGADIAMLEGADPYFKYNFCLHANETLLRLEHTPKLVIAAIDGHCVGGGLEIAMACDLRIARAGAGKCGLPEVKLGVLPGTGGTQRLVRIVGKSKAIELMASGDTFDATRAVELGIFDHAWEAESHADFQAKVLSWAQQFVPPNAASRAVGLIKRACQTGAEIAIADGLALERELQQRLFESADAREGLEAYNNKRKPEFSGR
jgi:enoyl-CoA hydratase